MSPSIVTPAHALDVVQGETVLQAVHTAGVLRDVAADRARDLGSTGSGRNKPQVRTPPKIAMLRTPGCTFAVRASDRSSVDAMNLASDSSTPWPCGGSAPPESPVPGAARNHRHLQFNGRRAGIAHLVLRSSGQPREPPSAVADTGQAVAFVRSAGSCPRSRQSTPMLAGSFAAGVRPGAWRSTSTGPLPSSGWRSARHRFGGWGRLDRCCFMVMSGITRGAGRGAQPVKAETLTLRRGTATVSGGTAEFAGNMTQTSGDSAAPQQGGFRGIGMTRGSHLLAAGLCCHCGGYWPLHARRRPTHRPFETEPHTASRRHPCRPPAGWRDGSPLSGARALQME